MAEVESFIMLSARDVGSIAQYVGQSTLRVCVRAASVMLALAVFDYAWQRWQFEKSLRMSKQEIKEESKAQEGIRKSRRVSGASCARWRVSA